MPMLIQASQGALHINPEDHAASIPMRTNSVAGAGLLRYVSQDGSTLLHVPVQIGFAISALLENNGYSPRPLG